MVEGGLVVLRGRGMGGRSEVEGWDGGGRSEGMRMVPLLQYIRYVSTRRLVEESDLAVVAGNALIARQWKPSTP